MGMNITEKLIKNHLVSGEMVAGKEIAIKIDQTLTQDSTGTMAYLQFEAIGIPRVKTEKSVAYIDHNTLQTGFENADDHKYIQTVTSKRFIFPSPATASVIRCIWSASASPAKPYLAPTATPLQAAASGCLRLAQAVWM